MNGLSIINIELTSRCNKKCWMCGRRKRDKEHETNYGDIDFKLLEKIAQQIPEGTLVQFHWNGEPLLYPRLKDALRLFSHCIRQFDTNGILLLEKAEEFKDELDVLTISIIQDDDCGADQLITVREYLKHYHNGPRVILRCLGNVAMDYWNTLPTEIVKRVLHAPEGSFNYEKEVVKPEHGICLDMLGHLAIDRFGNVSPCVRFDPHGLNIIGDLNKDSLNDIWNGKIRKFMINKHVEGQRNVLNLCSTCDYYGIPRG